jgi:hypothetical protein
MKNTRMRRFLIEITFHRNDFDAEMRGELQ